jgi:hypothetical protein
MLTLISYAPVSCEGNVLLSPFALPMSRPHYSQDFKLDRARGLEHR